jgi:hypothetical protein
MSQSHRVRFSGGNDGAETVVIKLASDDETSRATGVGMGAYYREIAFYENLAERLGDALPKCLFAEYDQAEGWFTLVLEDIEGATQGDQIAGCTVDEAELAMLELAKVHAPAMGDLALSAADYLNQPNPLNQALLTALLTPFLERYGDRVSEEQRDVCERFVSVADAWGAEQVRPMGLMHGDYRLDNLLFGDGTCKVVDWQTVSWGPGMLDAAYFIGGGLRVDDRRANEERLVRLYYDELVRLGVNEFSWEQCWKEYRRQVFHSLVMVIAPAMVVVQTDRGDEMFLTVLERATQQILDLETSDTKPEPLRPEPEDEGRHAPGPEPLWNESWYFDGVSDDRSLGLYVRLGRVPNQDSCLYTVAICGPDRPAVMLVDAAAPLPEPGDDAQKIDTDGLRAEHHCEEPLQRFRVKVGGTAESHADHSAPLRSESGEPVEVELDLVWETDGIPYAWRQSTRYEIPCRVSGTVRVGDEEISFSGPGQRDHSWGARDWWATDWMWSGLHFDDGTRTHAVGVPQMPGSGVGYVQREGEIEEITSVTATEEVAENGLITKAQIDSGPDELSIAVEPRAFGALRLEAPDGRVSLFPRAMCDVRTSDGRTGTGWVEWNRVQS